MNHLFFSIVVPIYNVEPYLRECLDSLLAQDFKNFEAILVNDGSNDGSEIIAQEYASKYECFRLISQENKGLSEARNAALRMLVQRAKEEEKGGSAKKGAEKGRGTKAKKESQYSNHYVCFLDSDDYLKPDALARMSYLLSHEAKGVGILRYGSKDLDSKKSPEVYPVQKTKGKDFLISHPSVLTHGRVWLYAISMDLFLSYPLYFIPNIYFEDMAFIADILTLDDWIYITDEVFVLYRPREDSITRAKWNKERTIKALESYLAIMKHHYDFSLSLKDVKLQETFRGLIGVYVHLYYDKLQKTGYKSPKKLEKQLRFYVNLCQKPVQFKLKCKLKFPRIWGVLSLTKRVVSPVVKKVLTRSQLQKLRKILNGFEG